MSSADDRQNYRAYREALRGLEKGAPLVPHLGAHTAEISVSDQLLPTEVRSAYQTSPQRRIAAESA